MNIKHEQLKSYFLLIENEGTVEELASGDMQKKMQPHSELNPLGDLEDAPTQKSRSGLILVASLLDKPTNLGGIL